MLPADLIYGGRLGTGVSAAERPTPGGFAWPRADWPVALLPVRGREMDDGTSKKNLAEAEAVASVVTGCRPQLEPPQHISPDTPGSREADPRAESFG